MDPIIERFLTQLKQSGVMSRIRSSYLFGSRSRNDWRPDSDYDVLLVVDQKDAETKSLVYEAVIDILLETGRLVSLKIFTQAEFDRLRAIPTPFITTVLTEGVPLGGSDQESDRRPS